MNPDFQLGVEQTLSLLLNANYCELLERMLAIAPTLPRQIELIENIFVPTLWRIGELWQKDQLSIAQEKICTSTARIVLDGLITRLSPPVKMDRTFVGATFPDNDDTLASKIVILALMSVSIRPIFLGSGIEPTLIAQCAALVKAEAVWISHTHLSDLTRVVEDHDALRKLLPEETRVIIGGGGLSPTARRSIQKCTYYDSIESMIRHEQQAFVKL